MSDASGTTRGQTSRSRRVVRLFGRLAYRAYALALILLIVWVTWLAFSYLIQSLLIPAGPPERIVGLPHRLDVDLLRTDREDWLALTSTPHPRSPLSHYHQLGTWISHDMANNCTTSGCHAPLPHAKHKETRAFLNMHSTVLHCGVCHMDSSRTPLSLVWYDIRSGRASEPPAVVEAVNVLLGLQERKVPADTEDRRRIVALLQQAAADAGRHPQLTTLASRFRAAAPGGDRWDSLVQMAAGVLPTHFRGEYGRKLALADSESETALLGHPGTAGAVRRFLKEGDALRTEERTELLMEIHPLRRQTPLSCTECHSPHNGLVQFTELGYPPVRILDLTGQAVFSMIENIAEGRPFYLPRFLERQDER